MAYFYLPNQRYGTDKVARIDGEHFQQGAIYEIDGERGVCLGEHIAFSELVYPYRKDGKIPESIHCVFEDILSKNSLELIHWFVNHWFTSYHKVLPFRLGEIDQLIKRKKGGRKKTGGNWTIVGESTSYDESIHERGFGTRNILGQTSLLYSLEKKSPGQTLIVFPTVRSMHQHLKQIGGMEITGSILLHGALHASARAKAFWEIKNGTVHTIYATYSQIFWDWNMLKKIVFLEQHAWRYKNMQEPRYFVPVVLEKMSGIWGCDFLMTGECISQYGSK